jgi:hypothetical protein
MFKNFGEPLTRWRFPKPKAIWVPCRSFSIDPSVGTGRPIGLGFSPSLWGAKMFIAHPLGFDVPLYVYAIESSLAVCGCLSHLRFDHFKTKSFFLNYMSEHIWHHRFRFFCYLTSFYGDAGVYHCLNYKSEGFCCWKTGACMYLGFWSCVLFNVYA